MKRVVAALLAGTALVVACDDDDDYFGGGYAPPTFAGSGSSAASSGTSSSGGSSGDYADCLDAPTCGDIGCCPAGWRCIIEECVAPGIACTTDSDCRGDRFCALALHEPRCYPRVNWCDDARELGCADGTCVSAPDIALSDPVASCSGLTLTITNRGRVSAPAGVALEVEQLSPRDAGADADAGDAGLARRAVHGFTPDGVLPGEKTRVTIPVDVDYRAKIKVRIEPDAGAPFPDCRAENDAYGVSNFCTSPK